MSFVEINTSLARRDVEALLRHAYALGASDVFFQTNEPVRARVHGENIVLTQRRLTAAELPQVVDSNVRSTSGTVMSGRPADFADAVPLNRMDVVNWRVNATACATTARDKGMEVVFRSIPGLPPPITSLDVPEPLLSAFKRKKDGMVLVLGPTGSGKSTLLASIVRGILEDERNRVVRTIEAPIEFVYSGVDRHTSNIVSQSEVGADVQSFAEGVANCLRRAPTDILIGEMRDHATIAAGILAALTGHMVWTTGHAPSVAGGIYRLANAFGPDERRIKVVELLQHLVAVVVQNLLPKVGGGRIAVREYLVIDDRLKEQFLDAELHDLHRVVDKAVREHGQSLSQDVRSKLRDGVISRDTAMPYLEEISEESSSAKVLHLPTREAPVGILSGLARVMNRVQQRSQSGER